jgi:biopolymer transport protein ExbD
MAGVDVSSGDKGRKRAKNSEINMIPFIDLLMVTIAFLMITAVWVTNSRLDASAQVPGREGCNGDCSGKTEKVLHVQVNENDFHLVWKQASTVVSEARVPKSPIEIGEGASRSVRYAELAKAIEREWGQNKSHSDPSDKKTDTAVLHSDDKTPFRELVAVMDAIHAVKRDFKLASGKLEKAPAFSTTFSAK